MCFEGFIYLPLLYTFIHFCTIHAYNIYAWGQIREKIENETKKWEKGLERGLEKGNKRSGNGCREWVQDKKSITYIHISYMYFVMRVVYYTCVYL